jgi:hypothetical protein
MDITQQHIMLGAAAASALVATANSQGRQVSAEEISQAVLVAAHAQDGARCNLAIGDRAGCDLQGPIEGVVIIGDDIRDLTVPQEGVIFLNERVAIGRVLFGQECNLQDLLVGAIGDGTDWKAF